MPNGGPDCCGTCWFNRANDGKAGHPGPEAESRESYCEIRDLAVDDPFYTYCANHPYRRPERDPIPIGPVTRNVSGGMDNDRTVWVLSPDSEEIRLHLIELLRDFVDHPSTDGYPIGIEGAVLAIWQLGEFRERRAEENIRWIFDNLPNPWKYAARSALDRMSSDG